MESDAAGLCMLASFLPLPIKLLDQFPPSCSSFLPLSARIVKTIDQVINVMSSLAGRTIR